VKHCEWNPCHARIHYRLQFTGQICVPRHSYHLFDVCWISCPSIVDSDRKGIAPKQHNVLWNVYHTCNQPRETSGNSWHHWLRWPLQNTRPCFHTTIFFTNSAILLLSFYRNRLLDLHSDNGVAESDDSDSGSSISKRQRCVNMLLVYN